MNNYVLEIYIMHTCMLFILLSVCLSVCLSIVNMSFWVDNYFVFDCFCWFCFPRGLDEKKYCTYSFTLVNKKFVRSFVRSLSLFLWKYIVTMLAYPLHHTFAIWSVSYKFTCLTLKKVLYAGMLSLIKLFNPKQFCDAKRAKSVLWTQILVTTLGGTFGLTI